jgi:hypothetical protein
VGLLRAAQLPALASPALQPFGARPAMLAPCVVGSASLPTSARSSSSFRCRAPVTWVELSRKQFCSGSLQLSMLDLSGRAPRHHRPRSVKDHLLCANIDTHRSAQIAVLFTANVTEKRQGVKRFRRPIAQFDVSPWTQKVQINHQVIVCLIFGQISKKPGNQSWWAAGASFFQQGYPPFQWIVSKNCTVAQLIDDLLT